MSFAVPRHVPDWSARQRQLEDHLWGSSRSSDSTAFSFGRLGKELPMYKDKPYNYPHSDRRRSKKTIALVALCIVATWWFIWPRISPILSPKLMQPAKTSWKTSSGQKDAKFWRSRRSDVVTAMEKSWAGYENYAWGYDEYHPNSKTGRQMVPPTGLGWIIVDALDTLMLMNLTSQLSHARQWISSTLTYDLDHDVNTFETTIRMIGGFLSAHYLQTAFPDLCPVDLDKGGEDLYLEKASDLADRVLGAFDSASGVPYASINLKSMKGIPSHADGGASSLAETTTLQLEFKYLANLTGEQHYWDKVEKVMQVVDAASQKDGLMPIYIHPESGSFTSNNIRLGSRGDSYYEYLIKQYLQTGETIYLDMWIESLNGIKKHLITYSTPSNFTVLAERPWGLDGELLPKMDHLVCFMPGTLALSTTGGLTVQQMKQQKQWTLQKQADLDLAIELMKTCWGMYKATKTGLAAEITHFHLDTHPIMYTNSSHRPKQPAMDVFEKDNGEHASWRADFDIKPADTHNLQRPETVESLFYMYRITEDDTYRQWGSDMLDSFLKWTEAPDGAGYTSIGDVNTIPPPTRNNMESFWPAETLKYFYLLFSQPSLLPLDQVVFNTEAHPFPRFQIGRLFKTGWMRKPPPHENSMKITHVEGHDKV